MADESFPSRATIQSQQIRQLQQLWQTVVPLNRFYTAKLGSAKAGIKIERLEDLTRCPFTTKSELVEDQEAHPPFGTNLTYPVGQYTRYHQTCGTMGLPLRWLDTPQSWDWMLERWMEI